MNLYYSKEMEAGREDEKKARVWETSRPCLSHRVFGPRVKGQRGEVTPDRAGEPPRARGTPGAWGSVCLKLTRSS